MQWLVVQLSPWAEKTMDTAAIAAEIRRRTRVSDLELYYPVVEDAMGKHRTAYSEYVFIESRQGVPLNELEGNDIFRQILRTPANKPQLLAEPDIDKIRGQIEAEQKISAGETVKITQGPLRGNQATVLSSDDGQVNISVNVGDEMIEAAIPAHWVIRRGQRRRAKKGR